VLTHTAPYDILANGRLRFSLAYFVRIRNLLTAASLSYVSIAPLDNSMRPSNQSATQRNAFSSPFVRETGSHVPLSQRGLICSTRCTLRPRP